MPPWLSAVMAVGSWAACIALVLIAGGHLFDRHLARKHEAELKRLDSAYKLKAIRTTPPDTLVHDHATGLWVQRGKTELPAVETSEANPPPQLEVVPDPDPDGPSRRAG